MSDQFYRAFEEKFRGSRQLIQKRLEVYLPFVIQVKAAHPAAPFVDLGCGRGEWLALIKEQGIAGQGVDLDAGMLSACVALGLDVRCEDALAYLRQLASESVAVISAFHLVEHLPFEKLRELVDQSKRVLVPGGLLIMETPNPENFVVATQTFYLDPTHQRPLPPDLLAFVPEYYGYETIKILRLQESATVQAGGNLSLGDVLGGGSQDYAVLAQKPGHASLKKDLQPLFDAPYGLSSSSLLERHRQQSAEAIFHLKKMSLDALQKSEKSKEQRDQLKAQKRGGANSGAHLSLWQWWVIQRQRLAEQGLQVRFTRMLHKLFNIDTTPVQGYVHRTPQLRRRLVALSQRLGLYHALKRLQSNKDGQASMNEGEGYSSKVSKASMSNHAQQIAQKLRQRS